MARRLYVQLACVAACGRVGFEEAGTGDANRGAGPDGDGVGDSLRICSAWSAPQPLVAVNSTQEDFEATLSPDGRWLVLASHRDALVDDLYLSDGSGGAFATPVRLPAPMNTTAFDQGPAWDSTGSNLYFVSNRTGNSYLWVASFADGVFGTPAMVPELASNPMVGPTLSSDGTEMFFADSPTSTARLWRTTRASTASPWQPPVQVAELASLSAGWPGLSADGTTLYFEGDLDQPKVQLYVATRAAVGAPFGPLVRFTELNDPTANEGDPFVSRDDQRFLFSSDRTGNLGAGDVYASTRTCQ